jgi:hypothetical protein
MKARHPIRAPDRTRVDDIAFTLCLSTFAAALAVVLASAGVDASEAASSTAGRQSPPPRAGTSTGSYVDGAPVYRMPAISVSASRKVEWARIEADDKRVPPAAATRAEKEPEPTALAVRPPRDRT